VQRRRRRRVDGDLVAAALHVHHLVRGFDDLKSYIRMISRVFVRASKSYSPALGTAGEAVCLSKSMVEAGYMYVKNTWQRCLIRANWRAGCLCIARQTWRKLVSTHTHTHTLTHCMREQNTPTTTNACEVGVRGRARRCGAISTKTRSAEQYVARKAKWFAHGFAPWSHLTHGLVFLAQLPPVPLRAPAQRRLAAAAAAAAAPH
jgi:hypothetical protein